MRRSARREDLDAAHCPVEEREEYEPHIEAGHPIWAGVDYGRIVAAAEREAELILWEGGNNDFPFVRPDLHIVLVDALRPDQIATHHPGEAVLRTADVVVIAKSEMAPPEDLERIANAVHGVLPGVPWPAAPRPMKAGTTRPAARFARHRLPGAEAG